MTQKITNGGYAFADVSPKSREQDVTITPDAASHHENADKVTHPAFGRVSAQRVQGMANLADVNYPQQHYVTLRISTSSLRRNLSRDWWHTERELIEVAMSEVQWAQMLAGMNTEGSVCTITRSNPAAMPPQGLVAALPGRLSDAESHKKEAQFAADKAMAKVSEAEAALRDLLNGTGSITKGKLSAILDTLVSGRRSATENLPFVVDSAIESIEEDVGRARAEVSAFIGHAMQELGKETIGKALAAAHARGEDPTQVLMNVIAPPRPDEIEDAHGDKT